jgi:hydroxyquinol 1,2-dioxygenase
MIIENQQQVTTAVLEELKRAPNPRFREIMSAFVRHLHDFAREVRLTEEEFQLACAYVNAIGQKTTPSHNEAVLMAGSLGLSSLICLLNNGNKGQTETAANMLGPFWRLNSPRVENGGTLVHVPTPGPPLFVDARVVDGNKQPIAHAEVDVWQSSTEGFYDNQIPGLKQMNLRGKLTTDANGRFWFRTILPAGYPIPIDGPVGELLAAQGRHNMRPAHLHFLIFKPGFKTLISQVYVNGAPYLDSDVQFGVTRALVGNYVRHEGEPAPEDDVKGEWYSLEYTFGMEPGEAKLPRAPIQ